ncbi:MAG TPA: hypothetical protein VK714_01690 [Myxococcota bacterium]|nr:hypothetical protein [Myxococcota bacterium]
MGADHAIGDGELLSIAGIALVTHFVTSRFAGGGADAARWSRPGARIDDESRLFATSGYEL